MKPSGTVLDRLILTSVNSVLSIHGLHEINDKVNQNISDHKHEPEHDEHKHESDYDEHESDHDEHQIMMSINMNRIMIMTKVRLKTLN